MVYMYNKYTYLYIIHVSSIADTICYFVSFLSILRYHIKSTLIVYNTIMLIKITTLSILFNVVGNNVILY